MSEKFMKVKRVVVPALSLMLAVAQMTGCGMASSKELTAMLDSGEQIEINVALPEGAEEIKGEPIAWKALASLDDQQDLRTQIDDIFGIIPYGDGKNGVLYVNPETEEWNNNNTLENVYKNKAFTEMFGDETVTEDLSKAMIGYYRDLDEKSDVNEIKLAALNAYFNIFPADDEKSKFEGSKYLTRAQFMGGFAKAHLEAQDGIEASADTVKQLGDNKYTAYAELVSDNAYLDLASGSLNDKNFNELITRAEVAYMLATTYYSDEFKEVGEKNTCYSDVKNAGDMAGEAGISDKSQYKAANLKYMVENPGKGLDTELYKAMVVIYKHNIFNTAGESRWNDPITKTEALTALTNIYNDLGTTVKCKNGKTSGDSSSSTDTKEEEKVKLGGIEYNSSDIENAGTADLAEVYGKLPPLTYEEWLDATSSIPDDKRQMYLNHVIAYYGPKIGDGVKELSPDQYVWFTKMDLAMAYEITDKEEVKKEWILTEAEVDTDLQDMYYGGNLSDEEKVEYEKIYGITKPEVTYTKKNTASNNQNTSSSNQSGTADSGNDSTAEQPPQESSTDTYDDDVSVGDSTGGSWADEYEAGGEFHVQHQEYTLDVYMEGM